MKGEWCYFKSYFNKQICEQIVKDGLKIASSQANLGVSGNSANEDIRKSKIRFIYPNNSDFSFLFDDLWKLAIQANNDFFNFHISKLDYLQLAEYSHEYKGEYKDHHDVFWINNDPFYHRKLSCIIQLSDPSSYEGGEFEIIDTVESPNKDDIKQQGSVIFFPSFLTHRANPVTEGTRYSIAAWFDGPKWR